MNYHFEPIEFEKKIPYSMRFKETYRVRDNSLYWVTQEYFTEEELAEFHSAFSDTGFNACYLIVRDDSTYNFDYDFEHRYENNMIKLTPCVIFKSFER